jgi:hypothetical protein
LPNTDGTNKACFLISGYFCGETYFEQKSEVISHRIFALVFSHSESRQIPVLGLLVLHQFPLKKEKKTFKLTFLLL